MNNFLGGMLVLLPRLQTSRQPSALSPFCRITFLLCVIYATEIRMNETTTKNPWPFGTSRSHYPANKLMRHTDTAQHTA